MQMVDDGKIALSPAYQIAALKPEEQQILVTMIDYTATISRAIIRMHRPPCRISVRNS